MAECVAPDCAPAALSHLREPSAPSAGESGADIRPSPVADGSQKISTAHISQWLQNLTRRRERTLLVLGGLEKVQDDGRRSGMQGYVFDGRLRNLLLDTADGHLGHLAVVVTTRFDLYDPLATPVPYY